MINLFELQTIAEREAKEAETEEKKNQWLNAKKSADDNLEYFEKNLAMEQIRSERDIAIEQLNELGVTFGEKPQLKAIPIEWIVNYAELEERANELCIKLMIERWKNKDDNH